MKLPEQRDSPAGQASKFMPPAAANIPVQLTSLRGAKVDARPRSAALAPSRDR